MSMTPICFKSISYFLIHRINTDHVKRNYRNISDRRTKKLNLYIELHTDNYTYDFTLHHSLDLIFMKSFDGSKFIHLVATKIKEHMFSHAIILNSSSFVSILELLYICDLTTN